MFCFALLSLHTRDVSRRDKRNLRSLPEHSMAAFNGWSVRAFARKGEIMADLVGKQIGNYQLLRLLGKGGFADVYLAEHIHLNTMAAIKVLQTRLVGNAVEQFRDEARFVARLKHPHIIQILDFGVE